MLQLFRKLTAPKFKGYVRRSKRKARSHICPVARAGRSQRSRHQRRPARSPPRAAGSRRQFPADAPTPPAPRKQPDAPQPPHYRPPRTAASQHPPPTPPPHPPPPPPRLQPRTPPPPPPAH